MLLSVLMELQLQCIFHDHLQDATLAASNSYYLVGNSFKSLKNLHSQLNDIFDSFEYIK